MANSIYDVHIATLHIIDNQLNRLHESLRLGDGDDDVTQAQITQLQEELARLSQTLGDAEVKNEVS